MLAEAQAQDLPPYASSHRRTQSGRILRSHRPSVGQMAQPVQDPRLIQRHTLPGSSVPVQGPPPPLPFARPESAARLFVNMNFRILRANQAFRDQFAGGADVAGRQIQDFIDHRHEGDLQRMQTDLRNEREALDPLSLPTIFSVPEQEAVESINEADVDRFTAGRERSETWTFSGAGVLTQTRPLTVRLGKIQQFSFVLFTMPFYAQPVTLPPPMPAFGAPLPQPGLPPSPWEPQFHQASPGPSSAGYTSQQPGSGPTTPSLSLQSLASSLPPSTSSVATYGLSSSRYDSSGYFPAQPRTRPSSGPAALQQSPAQQVVQAPPVPPIPPNFPPPPPTPASSTSGYSARPLSTTSEPSLAASGSRATSNRPTTYHGQGQSRNFGTMSAGESPRGSRTPGEGADRGDDEDDGRKRRRLNIKEITD